MYSEAAAVIAVAGLGKCYRLFDRPQDRLKQGFLRRKKYSREFWALRDITFSVRRGETVGIIGKNGSGKSTLLQMIAGTATPTIGTVDVRGRTAALLELGTGFNPEFTGRENVYVNGAILGLSRAEIDEHFDEIVDFAEIRAFIDQPVRTYSSGMILRLAFAVQTVAPKNLLIVDEVLAVGDEAFQRKCFAKIEEFRDHGGTLLFVSHSAQLIVQLCERAILIDSGELLLEGKSKEVVTLYQRLVHSPPESQDVMRRQILTLHNEPRWGQVGAIQVLEESRNSPAVNGPSAPVSAKARYDPELVPRQTVRYPSRGARIEDPHLADLDGVRINVIEGGDVCIWRYRVFFDQGFANVRFGMLIKTVSGLELGGHVTAVLGQGTATHAGAKVEVAFRFKASLAPGTYFLNAGVTALLPEGEVYLDRWVDAAILRVLPGASNGAVVGPVDFSIEPRTCNGSRVY